MTTNTNAAQVANNLIAVAEDQAFEAWYKQDCLVGGVNARIAARAAWNARAALTTAAAVPPEGFVVVPKVPDERMERAIAVAFFGTVHEARKAWVAGIAAAPKAEPDEQPGAAYAELPQITADDRSFLHYNPNTDDVVKWVLDYARAAITADRAMREQAAPAAVAGPVAYRVLRKRHHDGEWITDGRPWCDGVPTQDLVDDIALRSDGWRIEYAFAAPTAQEAPVQPTS